ncbi:ribonuclease YeeF family protein [Virgibacillus sp. FSP13]
MKVLEVSSLETGIDNAVWDIDTFYDQISAMQRGVRDFYGLEEALKGKGGEAIRSYFNEVHQPFLIYLYQSMVDYQNILTEMKDAIDSFESNSNGFVKQQFLEQDVEEGFNKVKKKTITLTDDANSIIDSVRDLVAIKSIDDSEVLNNVQDGKKKAEKVVERLNALDESQVKALQSVKEDLNTMKNYISDIESKFKGGDLSVGNFDMEAVKGIGSYNKIQEVFGPINDVTDFNFQKRNNDVAEVISAYESMFPQSFALTRYNVIDNMIAINRNKNNYNDITKGEVVLEGNSNGQHEITKGVEADLDSLGITYNTVRFDKNEIEINYAVEDGKFIIFKDNPDLYYYTQSAEHGKFNYYVAGATKAYGQVYSAYILKKGSDKIPGFNKITSMLDPKLLDFGKYGGSWMIKDNIPYVKDILGAEIPKAGSKEVILYISKDGENWDKGVRFVVKKGEDPDTSKFTPNTW